MIAERSAATGNSSGVEIDLFAGLTFPDVPSAPIEVTPRPSTGYASTANEYSKSIVSAVEMNLDEVEKISRKSGNLSALYATEVIPASSNLMYPDLPSLGGGLSRDLEEDATYSNTYSASQHDESESLLPKSSVSVRPQFHESSSATHQSVSHDPTYSATRNGEAPELITDLVMENSRLADEVANLRKMLSDQVFRASHLPR